MTAIAVICILAGQAADATAATPPGSAPGPASQPATRPAEPSVASGFLFKSLELDGRAFHYCVYVPAEYTPERPWPVILYLHGSEVRGSDGLKQTDTGIAHAIRRDRSLCPAVVVMPQCPEGEGWSEGMLELAVRCLQQTSGAYHLDARRVYLVGVSMGGAGVWLLGARFPDRFAALVPIAGFVSPPQAPPDPAAVQAAGERLTAVPIWCFHGEQDRNVLVEHSRKMVEAIRAAGGDVKYTELSAGGHNIGERILSDARLWEWLFAQTRAAASQPAP